MKIKNLKSKFAMNKRGDVLGPETLKIILAVISIVALIYLAFSLYGLLANKSKIEQARATIHEVLQKANVLEVGERTTSIITSPKDWIIISFELGNSIPECAGHNCLCMCEQEDCANKVYACEQAKQRIILQNKSGSVLTNLKEKIPFSIEYFLESIKGGNLIIKPI